MVSIFYRAAVLSGTLQIDLCSSCTLLSSAKVVHQILQKETVQSLLSFCFQIAGRGLLLWRSTWHCGNSQAGKGLLCIFVHHSAEDVEMSFFQAICKVLNTLLASFSDFWAGTCMLPLHGNPSFQEESGMARFKVHFGQHGQLLAACVTSLKSNLFFVFCGWLFCTYRSLTTTQDFKRQIEGNCGPFRLCGKATIIVGFCLCYLVPLFAPTGPFHKLQTWGKVLIIMTYKVIID